VKDAIERRTGEERSERVLQRRIAVGDVGQRRAIDLRFGVTGQADELVGVLTIGDIAVARDARTAIADISAAPPNS